MKIGQKKTIVSDKSYSTYMIELTHSGYELFEFNEDNGELQYYRTYDTEREAHIIAKNIFI